MKALAPLLLILLAVSPLSAAGIEKITTLRGKTYRQCEIVKVHPDGVSFTHANGAAKILFTDLSKEWRARLGYDADKAEAYQRELEQRRLAQEDQRRKLDEQQTAALQMAQQIELARLRGIEAQARAAMQAAAAAPAPEEDLVPVLPDLGAVHDSRDFRNAGYRDRFDGFFPGFFGYGGFSYIGNPGYLVCPPFHGHHPIGGGIRGRIGGTTFHIGR